MTSELIQGDTLSFLQSVSLYPASDGWELTYRLIPRASTGAAVEITASAEGASYRVAATAAATALWGTGYYSVASWVTKGAERHTVTPVFAQLRILANPATLAVGHDGRSHARIMLDAIESILEGRATDEDLDIVGTAAGGRSTSYRPELLMQLRSRYAAEAKAEDDAIRLQQGLGTKRLIRTRFAS